MERGNKMGTIINFSLINQYKLLYIIPTSGNRIYHVWYSNIEEMNFIENIIKNRDNLQNFYVGVLSSSCRVRKNFMPVPSHLIKQPDGFYHAYLKFETLD
jgi:hypothetical protein